MKNVAEQIKTILADRSTMNTRQRWNAALDLDINGKRGAPEAREIRARIKEMINKIESKYAIKRDAYGRAISNNWKSSLTRRAERESRLSDNQFRAGLLMEDAVNGYPATLLGFKLSHSDYDIKPVKKSITDLDGGYCTQYAKIGDWIVSSSESISYDNHAYSKSWHRRYGGKKSVDARTVMIRRFHNGKIENKDIFVESWRGQWALKALIDSGVINAVKVPKKLQSIQLNPAFDVRLIRSIMGLDIYERTLAGEHYDYCALAGTTTFHAATVRDAIKGLHGKLESIEIAKNSPINWDLCKKLGFCDTGIREFCSDFGLSTDGNYSPSQIESVVKTDLSIASKYEPELRKVAKVLNYTASI